MPNRSAKERKQVRRKLNSYLKANGRTAKQIVRMEKRNENRKTK